jgi:hypothetical protein
MLHSKNAARDDLRTTAEEHGAFQNEAIAVWRHTEAIGQPLDGVARQHQLDVIGVRASTLRETVSHGRADVASSPVRGS